MFIITGIGAIVFAILGLVRLRQNKDAKLFSYISLALTVLTIMAFYQGASNYVLKEDWSALMDVVPSTAGVLWICAIGSIIINSLPLFKKQTREN